MTMNENKQLRDNLRQVLAYCDELGYELGFAGVEAKQALEHRDKQAEPVAADHTGLIKRIDAAIERVTQGRGLMSIPADPRSDVDLVLSECKALLQGENPPFWATDFHPAQPVQPAGAQEPVGIVNYADFQTADAITNPDAPLRMAIEETAPRSIQRLPKGTKLYTAPPAAAINEATKWKAIAEFMFARRVYPDQLELGQGALDAWAKKWTSYEDAIAAAEAEKAKGGV